MHCAVLAKLKKKNNLLKIAFIVSNVLILQQSRNAMDTEETRLSPQKVTVRDKYCQTDHRHHGCCNQGTLFNVCMQ